ncbi:hypothetical protein BGU93_18995 [Clostridioides difficile]|nr:hypothetical protein BGU93_18995 [Clostridioides difficile]
MPQSCWLAASDVYKIPASESVLFLYRKSNPCGSSFKPLWAGRSPRKTMRDNSEKQRKQVLGRQKTGKNSIDKISGQGAMPY